MSEQNKKSGPAPLTERDKAVAEEMIAEYQQFEEHRKSKSERREDVSSTDIRGD